MTDASDERTDDLPVDSAGRSDAESEADLAGKEGNGVAGKEGNDVEAREELRREVEQEYDFEEFGPQDMAEMSFEEWDAAFDHDSWITGEDLLDRVEADLKSRVADRDVFAVVERVEADELERVDDDELQHVEEGDEPRLLAYSDEGYAVVYPDGSVEGSGTVLRDVKPSVALASMDDYEVPEMPEGDVLPDPAEVPEGSGRLGDQLMQVVAAVHVLAGVALFVAWITVGLPLVAAVAAVGFFVFGVFVFLLVANARLSDRFRAEEYRNRLRAVGLEDDERPAFLEDGGAQHGDDLLPDESTERPNDGAAEEVTSASDHGN